MKKTLFLITLVCFSFFKTYAQAVIRITAGTNLQTQIDNATNGTTFLVEPGSYGTIVVNKRIALIGSGYFLNSNNSAGCTLIAFAPGSDNSILSGFSISNDIQIGASGISILRNYVGSSIYLGYANGNYQFVGGNNIKQNFIRGGIYIYSRAGGNATNTLIKSNIILGTIDWESDSNNSGQTINNTILCDNSCGQRYSSNWSMTFINNIVSSTCNYNATSYPNGYYSTNNTFTNNIIKTTQFITSDISNKKLANFDAVFVGFPNNNGSTVDGRYQLLSTSPAKGAGIGGVDCGAFGGNEPYILQGIPIGPNVLSVTAPTGAAAGQTISVQIQAKVQN